MTNKNLRDRHFCPSSEDERLAGYVADKLEDTELLPFYVTCTRRYTASSIKKAMEKTLKKNFKKARDRRGFFFKQLIFEYAKESFSHSRHKPRASRPHRHSRPGTSPSES